MHNVSEACPGSGAQCFGNLPTKGLLTPRLFQVETSALLRDPSLGRELLPVVSGRSPMPAGLHALAGPGKSTGWELSLQIRDAWEK